MASVHKHIRSGTANKRPTTAIAEGQIALATNIASPGLFFKDSTGATIVKIGPVHVGATAPNVSPAGSAGNSIGEIWLDTSLTPIGVKIYNGSAFVNATPIGSTTVQGLLELATDAETQAGADTARAVTSASLQSKLSDSTSTTSNITIASSTAVKAAYDLANAALPKTGGTVTGNLEIGTAGSLSFEGATADGFETTIAVVDPTADRTITLPNTTGTVVTTGDTGTVTSTMILDGTILNSDVNASAAIAGTKISPDFGAQTIVTTGVHSAALGAAATPSITFTGDLNTGIFSPGADQVAVATNGTQRLSIDASGNVGVGISAPSSLLHLVSSGQPKITVADDAGRTLQVKAPDSSANPGFVGTTTNHDLLLQAGITAPGLSVMRFNTAGSERVRITDTGLVGIGTSSVSNKLHLSTTGTDGFRLAVDGQTYYNMIRPNGDGLYIGTDDGNTGGSGADIRFNIKATEKMRLTSTGLAIGTTSPSELLHVAGTIRIGAVPGTNTNAALPVLFQTSAGNIDGGSGLTYNPGADAFSVNGNSISSSTFSGAGNLGTLTCANGSGQYDFRATNDSLRFIAGSSEAGRFDSSARLLVGTTSARSNFYGTAAASAALQIEGQGGTGDSRRLAIISSDNFSTAGGNLVLAFQRSGAVGGNTIVQSGDVVGTVTYLGNDGTNFVTAASIQAEVDGTPGANDMPGRLVFATTPDGGSSPTERVRISNDGTFYLKTAGSTPSSSVSGAAWGFGGGTNNYWINAVNSTGTANHWSFINGNGTVGSITTNASTTAYNTSSDYRLKENIEPAIDGITRLQQLKPCRFNFTASSSHIIDGFIAHEVQVVVPECVTGEKDAVDDDGNPVYQGIDQSKLVPLLTAALQEAIAKIEILEARLTAAGIE